MIMAIAKRVQKPAFPVLPNAAKWRLNHPLHFLEESPALLRYAQPIYSLGLSVHKKNEWLSEINSYFIYLKKYTIVILNSLT
ncbi:hypothetical protein [Bacillus atrophaeus]|uniref:hypothetical protein n=1 Tax=Bacillus atrophaeus TaxID=1452 RepID=UPI001238FE20|nr:hypothetical protein [Bacillus atrophaeus]KAA6454100.1 hypothetical protein DX926_06710 [Bacillus atrophaeus]